MSSRDPLPSWNDGVVKQAILRFVTSVTDHSSGWYVPPGDRIATFDSDGTLLCERPGYVQAFFVQHQLRRLAERHPELRARQPYRAAAEGDQAYFHALSLPEVAQVILESHAGQTLEEFEVAVRAFLDTATHPRFGVRFTTLTYRPMLELLALLRANAFRNFIVTGGGIEFVRAFSEPVYGIAREDVTGSAVQVAWQHREGKAVLVREAALIGSPDEGVAKAQNIALHIGRRPILAAGNSPGDQQMLEYAQGGGYPSLCLLVNHDDAEREYAYESTAGTFVAQEHILDTAGRLGWTVVSMQRDFQTMFAQSGR
jgi:hypothetical protein